MPSFHVDNGFQLNRLVQVDTDNPQTEQAPCILYANQREEI